MITLCHNRQYKMFGSNKNYEAYSTVHFSEEGKHLSAEELYQQKTDQYYYMLDRKGKYFKTFLFNIQSYWSQWDK